MTWSRLLLFLGAMVSLTPCWGQTPVTINVHAGSPGIAIPRDFLGFSFETGSLTSPGRFPAENPVFQRMVSQLGVGLLRFGGNSVDKLNGWQRGQRTSSASASVLTSSDVDAVFAFAHATGWRVLFSLNLGNGDPNSDADEADYVSRTGGDVLYGFEIGNEPDLYHSNGLRSTSYTVNDYINEWQTYANAIETRVPGAVLTASAAAGSITSWTSTVASKVGSRIAMLTQHLYPLAPTSVVSPTAANAATIPNLLGVRAHSTEDTDGGQLLGIAQAAKIPWRMSETNSCYNGGEKGVSDVFASSLWGLDYMFTLAGHAAAGVNFHGGGTGNYTPIAISGSQISARPLYYALLMFHAAARGRIVPLDLNAGGVNLTAYGVLDDNGMLRVAVINKDMAQDALVQINPGPGDTTALAMRLEGPSLDANAGVTLGGAAVGADGSWSPAVLEVGNVSGGAYSITVRAGSAVLVSFGSGSLGVVNAASGGAEVAPNSFAAAYGQALGMVESLAASTNLPPTLAGVTATVTDSAGVARVAPLAYVSPSQVNFLVPAGAAPGIATVKIGGASGTTMVSNTAPGLFTMGNAKVAAASAVRLPNGQSTQTLRYPYSTAAAEPAEQSRLS